MSIRGTADPPSPGERRKEEGEGKREKEGGKHVYI
jgi:hypothetical protein